MPLGADLINAAEELFGFFPGHCARLTYWLLAFRESADLATGLLSMIPSSTAAFSTARNAHTIRRRVFLGELGARDFTNHLRCLR